MLACQPREMYVYTVPVVELVRKHFAAYATLFFFSTFKVWMLICFKVKVK